MDNPNAGSSGLSAGFHRVISVHFDTLQALPAPYESWTAGDTPRELNQILELLVGVGAIAKVGREANQHGTRGMYRASPIFWKRLQSHEAHSPILPCGHQGIQNVGNGKYSCAFASCTQRFSRDIVEEEING